MPKIDLTNPNIIRFVLENYEKERDLRVRWASQHADKFSNAASFRKEVKNYTEADIVESTIIAGMSTLARDHKVSARHKLKAPIEDKLLLKPVKTSQFKPTMVPVRTEIKELLKESRKDYLKKRNEMDPGDKYNFTESSNWVYGWKLDESELKVHGSAYGRVCYTQHALQSRVGPQPDPMHYKSADASRTFCARFQA